MPSLDDYFSLWRCTGYPKLGGDADISIGRIENLQTKIGRKPA